jgi:hypothetical protein
MLFLNVYKFLTNIRSQNMKHYNSNHNVLCVMVHWSYIFEYIQIIHAYEQICSLFSTFDPFQFFI